MSNAVMSKIEKARMPTTKASQREGSTDPRALGEPAKALSPLVD